MTSLKVLIVVSLAVLLVEGNPARRATNDENVHDKILSINERALDKENADSLINNINDASESEFEEGDILLTEEQKNVDGLGKRSAKTNSLWTNKVVPYEITSSLSSDAAVNIKKALDDLQSQTCITFRPKTSADIYYLKYYKGSGCSSYIGMVIKGGQKVSIGAGCERSHGVLVHETMHALGFWHEQSRPDRDSHVKILWENIRKGYERNFNIHNSSDIQGLDYDFDSVMHYGRTAFTTNGKQTIQAIIDPNQYFGQRNGASKLDITGINILYGCRSAPKPPTTQWSEWSKDCNEKCERTRERFCKDCQKSNSQGIEKETKKCGNTECKVKIPGHWGQWSAYSACSKTCGFGTRQRTRNCDNPKPKNGGANCTGSNLSEAPCSQGDCNGDKKMVTDFEKDYGIWSNHGQLKWSRRQGSTPSKATGPSTDHTSGTGYYAYVETSSPAKKGQQAVLRGHVNANSSCELEFYYHMYGNTMGKLVVTVTPSSGLTEVAFTKSQDQGDAWKRASISLKGGVNQVDFILTRGYCYKSDAAVDDIRIICNGQTITQAPTLTTIPPTQSPVVTTLPPRITTPPTPVVTTLLPRITTPPTPVVTTLWPRPPTPPTTGTWSTWGSWTACSETCGLGSQKRQRRCTDVCQGPFVEKRPCTDLEFKVKVVQGEVKVIKC